MQHQVLVLVCDTCKTEGDTVQTHEIDGSVVEACAKCWGSRRVSEIVKVARSPRRRRKATASSRRLTAVS